MQYKVLTALLAVCILMGVFAGCGSQQVDTVVTFPDLSTQEQGGTPTDGAIVDEALALNRDDITLVKAGETLKLYDGNIPLADIIWSSRDESIATFENGVVTAVAKGDTTVYAEYNGVKVSCKVYCNIKKDTTATTPVETTKPTQPSQSTEPTQPSQSTEPTQSSSCGVTGSRAPVMAAPSQETVGASFFDDAVFVGDSISLKLSQYAASSGALGKAKFLVVGSYGVSNAINDHPDTKLTYQGVKYTDVEKALAATGAKKVFIMLGMNDIGLYGIDKTISNWGVLLDLIRTACPNVTIYIQSMTPVWTGGEKGSLNNSNVNAYNTKLQAFAQSNGCKYIDIFPYMKDSTGGLATEFCSDSYVHLTNEGARRWIAVLKAYTGY